VDLLTIFIALLSIAGAVAFRLVCTELQDWIPVLSRRVIDYSVRSLPHQIRNRYREEWYAHLRECPGKLVGLWHAFGCVFGARRLARERVNLVGEQDKTSVSEVILKIIDRVDHARLMELY
jgi:hypothetical protein